MDGVDQGGGELGRGGGEQAGHRREEDVKDEFELRGLGLGAQQLTPDQLQRKLVEGGGHLGHGGGIDGGHGLDGGGQSVADVGQHSGGV